ncbi:homeobox domain-containing protein [Stemphylium lycopersici]|uniref:Homeobox domain-containing protein n=1 Tax=Stemphylium lycopersici TaxID=183478 RepID=A0A364N4X1_STELY|nr:homeobox domain-containing protein [Stemphylium lycopersici]RAR12145.1 homeobox domain-containing protein [Stemphylium lycopersici]
MALSLTSTTRGGDAATNDTAALITDTLAGKVLHAQADLRIQSCEDISKRDAPAPQKKPALVESGPGKKEVDYATSTESQANWWAEAIAKNMDLPDGYSKVAVLLIKWADELDELRTGEEAKELECLFRERFHYHTNIVELNVRRKAQFQLDNHISQFILENDGQHNLLIVYYTGHGIFRDDKQLLELTGSLDPSRDRGLDREARVQWNKAEEQLRHADVDADVLTILDTCYSSNLAKSSREEEKKFELLSACSIDQTTAAPGPNSYTRALIEALEGFLQEDSGRPISTFSLMSRINQDQRRVDTPSQLWGRSKSPQQNQEHIFLRPFTPEHVDSLHRIRRRPKGHLTLQFSLRDASLNHEQIDFMVKHLTKALNHKKLIGLERIDWVDMKPAPLPHDFGRLAYVMRVVTQWKKLVATASEKKLSQNSVDNVALPHPAPDDSTEESQKRTLEDADEPRHAKRPYLGSSHPPSPPVSESSRIDPDL